jgi:hypothetical protein
MSIDAMQRRSRIDLDSGVSINNAEFIWIGAVAQTSNEPIEKVWMCASLPAVSAYMCTTCHYR